MIWIVLCDKLIVYFWGDLPFSCCTVSVESRRLSALILLQSFRWGLNVKIQEERNQISTAKQIAPDYFSEIEVTPNNLDLGHLKPKSIFPRFGTFHFVYFHVLNSFILISVIAFVVRTAVRVWIIILFIFFLNLSFWNTFPRHFLIIWSESSVVTVTAHWECSLMLYAMFTVLCFSVTRCHFEVTMVTMVTYNTP